MYLCLFMAFACVCGGAEIAGAVADFADQFYDTEACLLQAITGPGSLSVDEVGLRQCHAI